MSNSLFAGLIAVAALFSVPALADPVITVAAPNVVFNYASGGAVPAPQAVGISASEAATITGVTVTYLSGGSPGWLSAFPVAPFATPNSLTLNVSPVTLAAGSYIADVALTAAAADPTSSLHVTVFLVVSGGGGIVQGQIISATPGNLDFSWSSGSPLPAAKILSVKVNDDAPFTASRSTDTAASWLAVSPVSSVSPGQVAVTVDPTGLSAGVYTGTITLSAPFAVTQVPVTLTVSGLAFSADPAVVNISMPENFGISAPQFVRVTSASNLGFQTSVAAQSPWLQVDVPDGTTPATIQIRANNSGLAQGTYAGTVTVRSGSLTSTDIGVVLTVGPPAPIGIQPASLSFNYLVGDPSPAVQTSRINSISANSQIFTSAVTTVGNGTWLTGTPDKTTTPAVMTVRVTPVGLQPGVYNGVVDVLPSLPNAAPQPIQVTLTVQAPPPPVIVSVNSSASYGGSAISPGQFVTIFGSGLGPKALVVPGPGPAPRGLGQTVVTFDGVAAPILYTSATQVGVQVPYTVTAGQQASIIVGYNGLISSVSKINVLAANPSLFTADSSGRGQLVAVNINPTGYNSASNPVARGAIISLYGTGEGKTNPPVTEGTITPAVEPLPRTTLPVSVTIGGQLAEVLYAGEAPGSLSGLLQLNVRVPDNAPTGSAVPVLVFVNSIPSQSPATIAIK
ncbi:MAG: hypothetical protein JWN34_1894 [Bryobacterales bacterium]|nr:hypothetical protein [Bryobacterales bacterium]